MKGIALGVPFLVYLSAESGKGDAVVFNFDGPGEVFDYMGDVCIWEGGDPPDPSIPMEDLTTHHVNGLFNVDKAKRIVEGRKTTTWIRPSQVATIMKNIEIDADHAMTRDLSIPIIAITLILGEQKDVFVIDGWHRLAKALIKGDLPVFMHILDEEETKRVTMSWSVTPIERKSDGEGQYGR